MRIRSLALTVVLAAAAAACAEPVLPDGAQPEGIEAPLEAEELRPGHDALLVELEALAATVAAARDRLVAAGDARSVAAAHDAGAEAVALLLDDPALDGVRPADLDPLFPTEDVERGGAHGRDRLTATLTVAREAGELGRRTADTLSEALAGDLGAWQRDPAGMTDLVRATVQSGAGLEDLEAAVLELPGEGTRALGWALLVADAGSAEDAARYAERGVAHLDIVLAALDSLGDAAAQEGL